MTEEKIEFNVAMLNGFILMTPKWRKRRGVILFLAPPGGPMAAIN